MTALAPLLPLADALAELGTAAHGAEPIMRFAAGGPAGSAAYFSSSASASSAISRELKIGSGTDRGARGSC